MTVHTPGPWRRAPDAGRFRHDHSAGIEGPDGTYVATALDFNRMDRDDEVEANARLIAAAPELLAMLRRIAPVLQEHGPATPAGLWQDLWALIDKAEGRES